MEANRFCTHCGSAVPPKMRFCTACGAEWVGLPSADSSSTPAGFASPVIKKRFFSGWRLYASIAASIIVGLMIIGALFGEEDDGKPSDPVQTQAGSSSPMAAATAAATTPAPATRPAATAAPVQAGPLLPFKDVTPIALNLPPLTGEELGSNNVVAEAQIRQAIMTVVPDLRGVRISVHRWLGKQDSLLIVDLDEAAVRRFPTDPNPVLRAIAASPAVRSFNITEIALLMAGRDNQGTYTITASMSLTTATALAAGQLSQQQIRSQVSSGMSRP